MRWASFAFGLVAIRAADAEQHLIFGDALELALAWQLRPAVALLADELPEFLGHDHAAGTRLVGDAARQVHRRAEPVAAARQALAAGDSCAQGRELLALLVNRLEQLKGRVEQRAGVRGDQHR